MHCFDSKIYVWATTNRRANNKGLIILQGQNKPLIIEFSRKIKGNIRRIEMIENKAFILTANKELFSVDMSLKADELVTVSNNCTDFKILNNFIFIQTNNSVEIIKYTIKELHGKCS